MVTNYWVQLQTIQYLFGMLRRGSVIKPTDFPPLSLKYSFIREPGKYRRESLIELTDFPPLSLKYSFIQEPGKYRRDVIKPTEFHPLSLKSVQFYPRTS